jgi:hypothetical protein
MLTISPIKDAHGNVIGASKIARDITDRKQAEAVIRDAQKVAELADAEGASAGKRASGAIGG